MEVAIRTVDLTKSFGELVAVDHVNFEVGRGEVFGFLGPNGAGKTTTIRMLVTLLKPTSGSAEVWGYDVLKERSEVRRSIGIVFQDPSLDDLPTGRENMDFHGGIYGIPKAERDKRIEELLELAQLSERADDLVRTYSRGMRRRLEIARGLMHHPKVLFLDEPTLGLDPQTRRAVWSYIQRMNKQEEVTIFLTTHYIEEADQLCNRIAVIVKGRIVTIDTPEGMKSVVQGIPVVEASFNSPVDKSAIGGLEAVGEVRVEGNRVGVLTKEISEALKALTCFVTERGLTIMDVNTVRPSLEDAFVRLTGVESEAMRVEKERGGGG